MNGTSDQPTSSGGLARPRLYGRAVRSGLWAFAARAAAQILSVARLIVLAWFLEPGDFGLMGIALVSLAFIETFTETGFIFALVQKPDLDHDDLDSAWSVCLIRGVLIFVAIYLAAPAVIWFFKSSAVSVSEQAVVGDQGLAIWVVRAFALTIVFRSITNIGIVFLRRELQFNKIFIIDTTGLVVDVAIAIVVAIMFRSVWALVCGKLAGESVRALMSYVLHPYRPSFKIDRQRCDKLWHFGQWMFWSTVCFYFLSQGDSIFVGRFIGIAALGLYQMAGRIATLPSTEISNVISQVTFPAYSRIQDDLPRLRSAYIRVLKTTAFISFPLAGFIIVFASDFTHMCLKKEWLPIIPIMQILAVNGLVTCVGSTMAPVFQSIGKPRTSARLQMVKLAILCIVIYPLTISWGIAGTAIAMLTASVMMQPLLFTIFCRTFGCRISELLRACGLPCLLTLLMVVAVILIRNLLLFNMSIIKLGLLAVIAVAVYIGGTLLADKLFDYGLLASARQLFDQARGSIGSSADTKSGMKGA